jgi:hypothetical protein
MSPMTTLSAARAANGASEMSSAADTAASDLLDFIPVSSGQRSRRYLLMTAQV